MPRSRPVAAPLGRQRPATAVAAIALAALAACGGDASPTGSGSTGTPGTGTPAVLLPDRATVTLTGVGGGTTVTLAARDARGGSVTPATVTWSSDQPTVATVEGNGVTGTITAVGRGSATIRAQAGSASLSIPVTVRGVQGVTLAPPPALRAGDTLTLRPTVTADADVSTTVRWTSSAPAVASVSGSGLVTALGPGTSTIVATATADPAASARVELTVWPRRAITLAPDTLRLVRERSAALAATVSGEPGGPRELRWRSSQPDVATVSEAGVVTGTGVGSATITALLTADTTVQARAMVLVAGTVRAIAVSPTAVQLAPGATRALTATVDADPGVGTGVRWASGAPSVVTVDQAGVLTGVGLGVAVVTASSIADPSRTASVAVTVAALPPVTVSITPPAASLVVGATTPFTAQVGGGDGSTTGVTWSVANPAVATINRTTGVATGVAPGTTTVTATAVADPSRTATATLTVTAQVTRSLTLRPDTVRVGRGQTAQVTSELVLEPGLPRTLQWRTSNPAVVTVSASGLVSGVAAGSATITAVSDADTTLRRSIPAVVAAGVQSVTIAPAGVQLQPGQSQTLVASVQADPGLSTAVTWSSSAPAVATVSATGQVSALAVGSTTITATSVADPSRRATASVVVALGTPRLAARWDATRLGGPLVEDVTGVWCPRAAACFAVNGTVGDLWQLVGEEWRAVPRGAQPAGRRLLAIAGDPAGTTALAVGTGGYIVRWDGTSWTTMTSGTTSDLVSVALASGSEAIAVGAGGTVLRLAGGSWTRLTAPAGTPTLNAVSHNGGAYVAAANDGSLLRIVGGTLSRIDTPASEPLHGVVATSATAAVAVGDFGTIVQLAGSDATLLASGTGAHLNDIARAPDGALIVAGDGVALRSNGGAWDRLAPPYATRLLSVHVAGDGAIVLGGQRGLVMEGRGGTWTTRNAAPDLLDVWTVDAATAFAVGELGFVYRWSGGTWARRATPTTQRLNGVWAPSATIVFAVGDSGTVLRSTDGGATWASQVAPTVADLIGVWGTSPSDVWAVATGGELLRWNGTAWSAAMAPAPAAMYGVFGASASEVFAVGDGGLAYRWNGAAWSRLTTNTSGLLLGVWAQSASNAIAVGTQNDRAIMRRWDGSSWQAMDPGTTATLTSIWGPNPADLYATGANGTIVRFDGQRWTPMTTGTTDLLWAVAGTPGGQGGLAVGYNSTVLVASQTGAMRAVRVSDDPRSGLEPGSGARAGSRLLPSGRARRVHGGPRGR